MIQIPATATKITTMADNSLRVFLDTQELNNEDMAKVMLLRNKLGYYLFKEDDFEQKDAEVELPKLEKDKDKKSMSQKLREVLYIFWQNKTSKSVDFNTYYEKRMQDLINSVKEKLN